MIYRRKLKTWIVEEEQFSELISNSSISYFKWSNFDGKLGLLKLYDAHSKIWTHLRRYDIIFWCILVYWPNLVPEHRLAVVLVRPCIFAHFKQKPPFGVDSFEHRSTDFHHYPLLDHVDQRAALHHHQSPWVSLKHQSKKFTQLLHETRSNWIDQKILAI